MNEPNGYAVLLDDGASAPRGFWFVGCYTTRETADLTAATAKQGARVVPIWFAPRPEALPTQAELDVAAACLRRHSADAFTPEELILARAVQRWAAPQPSSIEPTTDAMCLTIQKTVAGYTRRTPPHLRDCDVLTGHIVRAIRGAATDGSTESQT